MPTVLDLSYVALFAVAWPLFDYFVLWPAFLRRTQTEPERARWWLWLVTIGQEWSLVAAGVALWSLSRRNWDSLGMSQPGGWRFWGALGFLALLMAYQVRTAVRVERSTRARDSVRRQFGSLTVLLPHTRSQLAGFVGVSLTAGFCEEFLYRGYFIWIFGHWLGWWGAAILAIPFFAVLHAYQGFSRAVGTGVVGMVLTLIVAVFGSLWPAIIAHMLVDIGSGILAWIALREGPSKRSTAFASDSPQQGNPGGPGEPAHAPEQGRR